MASLLALGLLLLLLTAFTGVVMLPLLRQSVLRIEHTHERLEHRRRQAWREVARARGLQLDREDLASVLHGRVEGALVIVEELRQPAVRTEVRVASSSVDTPVETIVLERQLEAPRAHPLEVRGALETLLPLLDVWTRRRLSALATRGPPTLASHEGEVRLSVPGSVHQAAQLERLLDAALELHQRAQESPDESLRSLLREDPEESLRIAAAAVLATRLTPDNRRALQRASAQRGEVRLAVATALGLSEPLLELVGDEHEPLLLRTTALRRCIAQGSFAEAFTVALQSGHHEVRRQALLIARQRITEVPLLALDGLEVRLRHPDSRLAPALRGVEGTLLATLLSERPEPEAEGTALHLALWPDRGVQRAAVEAVGRIGGRASLGVLDNLEKHLTPASSRRLVRQARLRIISRLQADGAEAGTLSISAPAEEAGALSLARSQRDEETD